MKLYKCLILYQNGTPTNGSRVEELRHHEKQPTNENNHQQHVNGNHNIHQHEQHNNAKKRKLNGSEVCYSL